MANHSAFRIDSAVPKVIGYLPMTTPSEDSKVDVLGEARQLLDNWCERRSYEAICMMYGGLRSINGLTDGWEEFLKALNRLRILAKREKSGVSEAEAQKIGLLIGVVSRALNS
jgi:hypothetical protein